MIWVLLRKAVSGRCIVCLVLYAQRVVEDDEPLLLGSRFLFLSRSNRRKDKALQGVIDTVEGVLHFIRAKRHIPYPMAEASGSVDRLNSLVQRVSLCLVPRAIRTFDLKRQGDATLEADQEVGNISQPGARPHVINLEPEVIVLGIGDYVIAFFKNISGVTFPLRIADHMTDMRSGGREAWLGRVPGAYVTGSANRVFLIIDRRQSPGVLLGDVVEYVTNHEVDIQGHENTAPQKSGTKPRQVHKLLRSKSASPFWPAKTRSVYPSRTSRDIFHFFGGAKQWLTDDLVNRAQV